MSDVWSRVTAFSALLVIAMMLAGCQARNHDTGVSPPPRITFVSTPLQGRYWAIKTHPIVDPADPYADRSVCLRFEGDHAALESVDQNCELDGSHESLRVNPVSWTITLIGDAQQGFRTHADGSIFFVCDISDKTRDLYKRTNNVCFSRFSASDDVGDQALLAPITGPASFFGMKLYYVRIDTKAIASAVESAGVIPAALDAERQLATSKENRLREFG